MQPRLTTSSQQAPPPLPALNSELDMQAALAAAGGGISSVPVVKFEEVQNAGSLEST